METVALSKTLSKALLLIGLVYILNARPCESSFYRISDNDVEDNEIEKEAIKGDNIGSVAKNDIKNNESLFSALHGDEQDDSFWNPNDNWAIHEDENELMPVTKDSNGLKSCFTMKKVIIAGIVIIVGCGMVKVLAPNLSLAKEASNLLFNMLRQCGTGLQYIYHGVTDTVCPNPNTQIQICDSTGCERLSKCFNLIEAGLTKWHPIYHTNCSATLRCLDMIRSELGSTQCTAKNTLWDYILRWLNLR